MPASAIRVKVLQSNSLFGLQSAETTVHRKGRTGYVYATEELALKDKPLYVWYMSKNKSPDMIKLRPSPDLNWQQSAPDSTWDSVREALQVSQISVASVKRHLQYVRSGKGDRAITSSRTSKPMSSQYLKIRLKKDRRSAFFPSNGISVHLKRRNR